ncbi:MAG: hypothetical protein J6P61_01250 [Erysipelotrichaceae bacterium]|nr:hypothetical protein [Erysipelotrichaceae bacterium]
MQLSITESEWSGWTNSQSEPKTTIYDIELNKKYVINVYHFKGYSNWEYVEYDEEIFSFEITEINYASIKIHTFQYLSASRTGSINLLSEDQDFRVSMIEPLTLKTLTMDAGWTFELKLI